jgi:hypothetical protein
VFRVKSTKPLSIRASLRTALACYAVESVACGASDSNVIDFLPVSEAARQLSGGVVHLFSAHSHDDFRSLCLI